MREKALTGRSVVPGAQVRKTPFARYEMRVPTPYEWIYKTRVSPDGGWQVVFNIEHFLLINARTGQIKEVDLGERLGQKRWALDAQWSPDGERLAMVASIGDYLPRVTQLLLLDLQRGHIRGIEKPSGVVLSELDWAPGGRLLLAFGDREEDGGKFAPVVFLIDTESGGWREADFSVPGGGRAVSGFRSGLVS